MRKGIRDLVSAQVITVLKTTRVWRKIAEIDGSYVCLECPQIHLGVLQGMVLHLLKAFNVFVSLSLVANEYG